MHDLAHSDLATLRRHEQARGANMTLGGYHMETLTPAAEFAIYRGSLNTADGDRLYLISQFLHFTHGASGRVRDVLRTPAPGGEALDKAIAILAAGIDLVTTSGYEPVVVTPEVTRGPLLVIDGHHRLTAHIFSGRPLDGVAVYVCEHPRLMDWRQHGFIPPTMRYP